MSGKKALITGITGHDGADSAKFLLDKGYEVGTHRRLSTPKFWRLQYSATGTGNPAQQRARETAA